MGWRENYVYKLPSGEIVATYDDITDRKHAEEQIRKALEEKIILLREIYHRTRNNMQIMSTLLGFQSRQIEDEHVVQLFKDAQQRINAMALVHQKLYREDLTTVNLQEYIPDRKNNRKRCPLIYFTFHTDCPTVQIDKLLDD